MILHFTTSNMVERKQGLYYMLLPAYFILNHNKELIIKARTSLEVIELYKSGGHITYDTNYFMEKINEFKYKLFFE